MSSTTVVNPKPKFELKMGVATREAYGQALVELGKKDPNIVVLDADLAKSTFSAKFQKEFPDVSAEEIFRMVTMNPALALQEQDRLGKICAGFVADLIAIPITRSTSVFEEIIAPDRAVDWSMIGGRILA